MINLLPPQQKKELLMEDKYRLVLILGVVVLSFLISLSLILFSIKLYVSGQAKFQEILFDSEEKGFQNSESQELEKELSLSNQNLLKLQSFYKRQFDWSGFLEKTSKTVPPGIYLTSLSFSPVVKEENRLQVSIAGFSPDRETLFEFKKNLEANEVFENIYFSPINWVSPRDINFHITLMVEI